MKKTGGIDDRQRAYFAGACMSKMKMAEEAPLDAAVLDAVEASDIVVVQGSYARHEVGGFRRILSDADHDPPARD